LTKGFLIEFKLTQRTNSILLGIEVLSLPARPIQDRGYSHGSLNITLQRGSSQGPDRELESTSPAEDQKRGTVSAATLMISSLHKTTSSVSSKTLARSWLSDCLTRHAQCSSVVAFDHMLPSRLLHIKQSTDSDKVQLALRSQIPASTHYITLSHCWGGIQPLRLTTGSFDQLRHAIHIYELPKTFYNAVRVTIALSCEYLWIDSLHNTRFTSRLGEGIGHNGQCLSKLAMHDSSPLGAEL
jgi:hypothetical protein